MPPIVIDDYPYRLEPRWGYTRPPHKRLFELLNARRLAYADVLRSFLEYRDEYVKIPLEAPYTDPTPAWVNGFLPGLDSAAICGFLWRDHPRLYLEIGSGNSTKFARHAIQARGLRTKIVSIDPHPRAEVDSCCDEVIRQPVEDVDLAVFSQLEAGDILFVDHSHRSFMNSDATVVFLDIMPELKPGVLLHIHDIYLPWDYPADWIDRHYNEQYLLACFLLSKESQFEVILPNTFISIDPELSQVLSPLWNDPAMPQGISLHGASFWLRVKDANATSAYKL